MAIAKFEYAGQSTEDIISEPLYIVGYDGYSDSLGMSRSKVEGERTISRLITNEYGTIYDPLSFNFALMKSDKSTFTRQEQVAIESWLTSPKLSSELQMTDCGNDSFSYYGIFTNTQWIDGDGGLCMCNLTFLVNGAYAYKNNIVTGKSIKYFEGGASQITNGFTLDFFCDTNEYQEYIYPVIKVKAITKDYDSSFKLTNITDDNKTVNLTTNRVTTMCLDCENCIVSEFGEGIMQNYYINLVKYKDIGWDVLDNIYWPKIYPGRNRWDVTGRVQMDVIFKVPYKVVGGWRV